MGVPGPKLLYAVSKNIPILLLLFTLFLSNGLLAQKTDPPPIGSVKGKVKDSTYNFMLISATVAVYKSSDSSLLQFSLPDNFGEFLIQPLPLETPLYLVITHVGYKPFFKGFTIEDEKSNINFGMLYMHQDTGKDVNTLEEVVVKALAPMRMNGDTLEFNADAFRLLDSNATAEDLIRRLPGFTIWGDGEITFNGKKINAVLVDGKPFMGSTDITIATQNLPKDALDKIQVYQQRDEKNPLDSTLFANIKLKEDKKMGHFGKLSGGYGTDDHYTGDGILSGFNKKLQVSAAAAANNINKLAGSTDVLIKNGSFKGEGTQIEYQSDFNIQGLNKPVAAGIKFQYDFIPDPGYQKDSRLNADYFIKRNTTLVNNNSLVNNFLEADNILSLHSINTNRKRSVNQRFNSRYQKSNQKMNLGLNAFLNTDDSKDLNESTGEQEQTGLDMISSSLSRRENETKGKSIGLGFTYSNRQGMYSFEKKRIPREFTIDYQFSANDRTGRGKTHTEYISAIDPGDNRVFDRIYERRDARASAHRITVSYPGLKGLIFNKRRVGNIQIGLSATAAINDNVKTDKVLDRDTVTGKYLLNNYLSNLSDISTRDLQPAVTLSKSFYKGLTNRYNKSISIAANLQNQYYSMTHEATRTVQNFSYRYARFIPNAEVSYNNHQYGSYDARYQLAFKTAVGYPDVNNIAPLVDSTNLRYIPKGNAGIKPQYKKELVFSYHLSTRKPKNPLILDINAGIGKIDDKISDSLIYDKAGVRTEYAVNINGHQYVNGGAGIRKSVELKKNTTLELDSRYTQNRSSDPQYIDGMLNLSNSIFQSLTVNLAFRYKDLLNIKTEQGWNFYISEQKGFNNSRFKNRNQFTRLIGTIQFPRNLMWSSNITRHNSTGSNSKSVAFTIWNAGLTYRFLTGNRGEVKFQAMDLLRQNKGIENTSSGNTQKFSTSNVLQQYFMLTLSYYPRKFGK